MDKNLDLNLNLKSNLLKNSTNTPNNYHEILHENEGKNEERGKKQNFGLLESEFEQLTLQLKQGNEQLFGQIFRVHFEECRRYLIKECNASPEDAYDFTVETIIQFRQLLLLDKLHYGNLRFLFTKMAKDAYLKYLDKAKRLPTEDLDDPNYGRQVADNTTFDELLDEDAYVLLGKAMAQISDECHQLLKNHFFDGLQFKLIASYIGDTDVNVRKRKERCMEKLRSIFFKMLKR